MSVRRGFRLVSVYDLRSCLNWRVNRVVREIEEKGACLFPIDEGDALIDETFREVLAFCAVF